MNLESINYENDDIPNEVKFRGLSSKDIYAYLAHKYESEFDEQMRIFNIKMKFENKENGSI